jgi:hypothetical protein
VVGGAAGVDSSTVSSSWTKAALLFALADRLRLNRKRIGRDRSAGCPLDNDGIRVLSGKTCVSLSSLSFILKAKYT